MEELVWSNNSSMLAGVTNRFPWDSGTMISFQIPASFSGSMPSTAELYCGNVDDNSILGIQQQPDVSYGAVQPNAFAHQHPHHPLNQMTAQAIPRFLDKVAADSVLTSPRSVSTGWGHAVSSSVATNIQLLQSIPEINPDYLHNTNACLGEAGSSPCNDLMQFSYSYDDSQHRNLQSSLGSLHYVVSSDDAIQKDDGISPISTTENNVIGNMNSLVLSASNPPQKSTSTIMSSSVKRHSHSINIIEDYQSTSQGSFNPIIMKSKAVKSKSKPKPKTETFEDNPQLGMQYNYSSPSSSSCLVFGAIDPAGIEPDEEAIASMREMIYSAAALRPVNLGTEVLDKPKRKNVKISSDPQTIAARQRREKISERIRILQRLVPGGTKMDTASMLDEAISYLKFLKTQIKALQSRITSNDKVANSVEINSIAGLCFSTINSLESLSFSSALHSRIYQNPTCGK